MGFPMRGSKGGGGARIPGNFKCYKFSQLYNLKYSLLLVPEKKLFIDPLHNEKNS